MNKELTHIVLVADRSGSMHECKEDAQGGINQFIEEQKNGPGKARFTLVQFDDRYEFVHDGVPIEDVPPYELHPRSVTALLDAVGRAIVKTKEDVEKLEGDDKPGLVIFVIVTDGLENASKEFGLDKIKELIKERTDADWQFMFLGAGLDAFEQGGGMRISASSSLAYNKRNSGMAYQTTSAAVMRGRVAAKTGEDVGKAVAFTDKEREANA